MWNNFHNLYVFNAFKKIKNCLTLYWIVHSEVIKNHCIKWHEILVVLTI